MTRLLEVLSLLLLKMSLLKKNLLLKNLLPIRQLNLISSPTLRKEKIPQDSKLHLITSKLRLCTKKCHIIAVVRVNKYKKLAPASLLQAPLNSMASQTSQDNFNKAITNEIMGDFPI